MSIIKVKILLLFALFILVADYGLLFLSLLLGGYYLALVAAIPNLVITFIATVFLSYRGIRTLARFEKVKHIKNGLVAGLFLALIVMVLGWILRQLLGEFGSLAISVGFSPMNLIIFAACIIGGFIAQKKSK